MLKIRNWKQIIFQDASNSNIELIIFIHDHAILILVLIISFIIYIIITIIINKIINRNLVNNHLIEIIWTVIPIFILIFIAFPSIYLLYLIEEIFNPKITIKTLGHQWYWRYEYSNFKFLEFDSYIIPTNNLNLNNFRLLEVDNALIIPFKTSIRILIRSTDVIHSWTIPSASIKTDAIPGRLNQSYLNFNIPGLYYGQCSEICGSNHRFIPIVIESIKFNKFIKWILSSN